MKVDVRNIVIVLAVVVMVAVLGIVMMLFVPDRNDVVCTAVNYEVSDSDQFQFVKEADLRSRLQAAGINPEGRTMGDIDLTAIEAHLLELNMVKDASASFSTNGMLNISVTQRVPKFRVKTPFADFYIDTDRKVMPTSIRSTAHVPVVTGSADEEFLKGGFFDFIDYIEGSSRWHSAFTQYVIAPDNKVTLVPRVGDFVIVMGHLDRYEAKLYKLEEFYGKVPEYFNWNVFSTVNLEFQDQVVCTYKNKR